MMSPLIVDGDTPYFGGAGNKGGKRVCHAPQSAPTQSFDNGKPYGIGADDFRDLHAPYAHDDESIHKGADEACSCQAQQH